MSAVAAQSLAKDDGFSNVCSRWKLEEWRHVRQSVGFLYNMLFMCLLWSFGVEHI